MQVRKRILDEAAKQFLSYGIRNITMDDIAVSLGISKRTVYEKFKNKTELVFYCLQELTKHQLIASKAIINKSSNVIDSISCLMQEGIKMLNSINPVFFSDLKKFYPEIAETVYNENVKTREEFTYQLLRRGIDEGIFREDINIKIVAKLFHEQINVISDEKMFPPEEYNFSEVYRNLVINFMRGISTSKGISIIEETII